MVTIGKVQVKLEKQNLFATPKSFKEIEDWIELHAPEDRAHLYTASMMTWNYLVEAIEEAQKFGGDSSEHL
jgi:hypothetical protein